MAQSPDDKIFNANDTIDINELVSLNNDISPEFLDQLQNQVSQSAEGFIEKSESPVNDGELFEEVAKESAPAEAPKEEAKPATKITIDPNIDDNFIKKYKAKLNKQANQAVAPEPPQMDAKTDPGNDAKFQTANPEEIAKLTGGNIVEKPAEKAQVDYNDSLDYLDGNVKYTKYVIYINPENKDFIESLTVKERKNLINRILREQDDIAITKKRLAIMQSIIKHAIVAIITVTVAVPIIYWTINTSLEASINNYRHSQSLFKTLYREQGKIKTK